MSSKLDKALGLARHVPQHLVYDNLEKVVKLKGRQCKKINCLRRSKTHISKNKVELFTYSILNTINQSDSNIQVGMFKIKHT